MEYITRNIKICIWDLVFGPLAWALGTLGPKIWILGPLHGPFGTLGPFGPGPGLGPNKRTMTNCHSPLKWTLGDKQ